MGLPGGESFRDFHERVWSGFEATLADYGVRVSPHHHQLWDIANPDLRLVFVAHGGTNGLLLARLLGTEPVPWEWERFFHQSRVDYNLDEHRHRAGSHLQSSIVR